MRKVRFTQLLLLLLACPSCSWGEKKPTTEELAAAAQLVDREKRLTEAAAAEFAKAKAEIWDQQMKGFMDKNSTVTPMRPEVAERAIGEFTKLQEGAHLLGDSEKANQTKENIRKSIDKAQASKWEWISLEGEFKHRATLEGTEEKTRYDAACQEHESYRNLTEQQARLKAAEELLADLEFRAK